MCLKIASENGQKSWFYYVKWLKTLGARQMGSHHSDSKNFVFLTPWAIGLLIPRGKTLGPRTFFGHLKHTRILSINEWINELYKSWHVDQNSQNNAWSFTIYYKIFDIYSQYCFKNIKNFIKKMVIFKENDNKITTQKIILIQCCVLKSN